MKDYALQDLRNVCLLGSQGDGKTSLAETMFFNSGATNRLGKIEEGNTIADHSEEEIKRKISIYLDASFIEHKNKKINILTTPGYSDFNGELLAGLEVSESAIFVMGADTGVTHNIMNLWESIAQKQKPIAIFLNKLDRENLDFEKIFNELQENYEHKIVPITIPDATGHDLKSVNNLLSDPKSDAKWRDILMEAVSSTDDALTEKYLEGKEITEEELKVSLKSALKERKIFPLFCGSAIKNIGSKELVDFIVEYMPAPVITEGAKFSGLIFKSLSEPGMGQINFVKIHSGSLQGGKDLFNFTKEIRERSGQLCFMQGKKKIDVTNASAGDIVGVLKLKDAKTNDVLGEEKQKVEIKRIGFPESIYKRAIKANSKGDEEKIGNALSIITIENPTIKHFFDPETKEVIVAGMGSLQLEIMASKIKARYGVEVKLENPRIPYKETIRGKTEVQGKYKRQSGGRGQYGDCWLRIEPLQRGSGFEFVDKIVGGVIPKGFIPAVEKGVREAMEGGVVAGYPVVDLRVTVYDGSYHDVDSSEMAFKIAGSMALRKGVNDSKPIILEPIMTMEINVPSEYMGAVMGDLNSRRGRVQGMEETGKKELIKAQVPLSEVFQYATDLRSLTKGSGCFTMKLSHYDPAPPNVTQNLIDIHEKSKEEAVASK